jgi:hypothetical protein
MEEKKPISEKELMRRKGLAERREAGYRAYIERKHKEMEEREEKKRLEKEEKKKKTIIKKRKVGRPKKRGPKKKRKYVSRKPKIDKRSLNIYDYKLVSCHNGKQNGYIGAYINVEEAYEDIERLLKENKNVVFPARVQIAQTLEESRDEYLLLERNRHGDKEEPMLRNSFGKLVRQETNSDTWIVLDKFSYDTEETFWVYGYDPLRGRKTFDWIYYNIIIGNIETKFDIKRVMLYKNKIVVKDDAGNLDIVFCKTMSDAIRFYNLVNERVTKGHVRQVMMLGNYSLIGDKRRTLEDELVKKTGWTKRKIQMVTSKKCKL